DSSVLPVSSPLTESLFNNPPSAWSSSAMRPPMASSPSKAYVTRASVSSDAYGFDSSVICMMRLSPPVAIESLFRFFTSFLGAFVLTAVPLLLALRQCDFNLRDAVAEINLSRNDGQALGLGPSSQLIEFIFMQQ